MLNYRLHEQIEKLRKSRKMSQVELAKRLGVTKGCVSNWENDNAQPSIEMLVRLATLFSVSTDFLLGLDSGDAVYIDATGLSGEVVAHVQQIVDDLRGPDGPEDAFRKNA